MDINTISNADLIKNLPTDKVQPSPDEIQMMDILFKNTSSSSYGINNLLTELKDVLTLGILFILFSIPQLDTLFNKFIPITSTSPYILILSKTGFIMMFYWIIKHFYLMKK